MERLGLSIVRAAAIMYRGDVFARSEGGINTFGLTFEIQADKTASNVVHHRSHYTFHRPSLPVNIGFCKNFASKTKYSIGVIGNSADYA